MRFIFFFAWLFPLFGFSQAVNIIPNPSKIEVKSGFLNFKQGLSIKSFGDDEKMTSVSRQFANSLFGSKAWKVPGSTDHAKLIVLKILPAQTDSLTDESYTIRVFPDSVLIEAHTYHGLFYGCQSAVQLFVNSVLTNEIPCMEITDTPQYAYRGMELDVCRHFFSKEVVKQYLDLMVQLKMNVFHWHLTDDQGWRIDIKKYPRLTEIGAWRSEKDGSKYGGYYTQQDIQEIVAYAAERFITVIPEIELPGHSSAAIAAYPWLSCTPKEVKQVPNTWGIKKDIYSPGDSTFRFVKDVLDEVCSLFPGTFIHMGGDEAPKEAWEKSSVAQALIQKQHLKNVEELQHYFLKNIEDYLATKGKRCIGWGEIVKGGLSDSVVVMSWLNKQAGLRATEHGNQVIMTPRVSCYFDYPQKISDKKPAWWMLYLGLNKVYQFTPMAKSIPVEKRKLVLGGQANVWTEYITDEKQLHHQVMPRLAAMAEALWSKNKNFVDFKERLNNSGVLK